MSVHVQCRCNFFPKYFPPGWVNPPVQNPQRAHHSLKLMNTLRSFSSQCKGLGVLHLKDNGSEKVTAYLHKEAP
jgi:hypothetical protein